MVIVILVVPSSVDFQRALPFAAFLRRPLRVWVIFGRNFQLSHFPLPADAPAGVPAIVAPPVGDSGDKVDPPIGSVPTWSSSMPGATVPNQAKKQETFQHVSITEAALPPGNHISCTHFVLILTKSGSDEG